MQKRNNTSSNKKCNFKATRSVILKQWRRIMFTSQSSILVCEKPPSLHAKSKKKKKKTIITNCWQIFQNKLVDEQSGFIGCMYVGLRMHGTHSQREFVVRFAFRTIAGQISRPMLQCSWSKLEVELPKYKWQKMHIVTLFHLFIS